MNFSSPAPFWKYVDLPSTPAKQSLDLSPIKMKRDDDAEKEEEDTAQPSSPPLLPGDSAEPEDDDGEDNDNTKDEDEEDMGPDSPSRTVSRPVSRRDIAGPTHSRSNSNVNSFMANAANGGMVRGASLASFEEEPEEEESFDLSK
jgi:hypothetical protein